MIDKKEVIRYLGYGRTTPDERTMELIDSCMEEILTVSEPAYVIRRLPLKVEEDRIQAGDFFMRSRHLAGNLRGCDEVILFAATLGGGVDLLMRRYSRLNVSRAAILQAAGGAAIEGYCNSCQRQLEEELKTEGLFLRPRFSPGYGDLALENQKGLLETLNAARTVGILLSEGGLMVPEKSVSAIMGITRVNSGCHIEGCEICNKKDCAFRREN